MNDYIIRYAEKFLEAHNQDVSDLSDKNILDTLTPCALPVKESWIPAIKIEIIRLSKGDNKNG